MWSLQACLDQENHLLLLIQYAEGQRRYVESLSAYARQFLDKMKKPKVDLIEGLSPAISIEQKNTSKKSDPLCNCY